MFCATFTHVVVYQCFALSNYVHFVCFSLFIIFQITTISCARKKTNDEQAQESIENYLHETLNDPQSYQAGSFIVMPYNHIHHPNECWEVLHDYRAKNGYGALILNHNTFYLDSVFNVRRVENY